MKKVYQSKKHRRYQAKRGRAELRKTRSVAKRETRRGLLEADHEATHTDNVARAIREHVKAPDRFSFVDHTDDVAAFFSSLANNAAKSPKNLFVDLRSTRQASVDALTALICMAHDLHQEHGTNFILGWPSRGKVRRLVAKSGFDDITGGSPRFHRMASSGSFSRRSSNRVEEVGAEELVAFALKYLRKSMKQKGRDPNVSWMRWKERAAYGTLVECMSNTKGHACKDGTHFEDWWMSVYFDRKRNVAQFSFVDNGVGILKSGNVSRYKRLIAAATGRNNADLLQDALEGKIPSQTQQKGRGEGLPAMRRDCVEFGLLDNLTIISNDVKKEVGRGSDTILRNDFSGTFIYWEISTHEAKL